LQGGGHKPIIAIPYLLRPAKLSIQHVKRSLSVGFHLWTWKGLPFRE